MKHEAIAAPAPAEPARVSGRTICATTGCSFSLLRDHGVLRIPHRRACCWRRVNVTNLILQNSYIVIMALGMLLIIVGGNIDLSVGSIVGFVGAIAATMMVGFHASRHRCQSCLAVVSPSR